VCERESARERGGGKEREREERERERERERESICVYIGFSFTKSSPPPLDRAEKVEKQNPQKHSIHIDFF
jgi:hypothetical protein